MWSFIQSNNLFFFLMSHMKRRKPGKLYTFQNTQANHLLGVRADRLATVLHNGKIFLFSWKRKWDHTRNRAQQNTDFKVLCQFLCMYMNQAVSSHSQGSQRREDGEGSTWDQLTTGWPSSPPWPYQHLLIWSFQHSLAFLQLPPYSRVCKAGKPKRYKMIPITWPKYLVSTGDQSCYRTWSLAWSHRRAKDYEDMLLGSPEEATAKTVVEKSKGDLISHGAL